MKQYWKQIALLVGIIFLSLFLYDYVYLSKIKSKLVTIAVSHTPLSAPFYIAEELNLFQKNGLDAKLIDLAGGKKCFDALMASKVEYATSSESVSMFARLQGKQHSLLSTFVESDNDIKLLFHRQSGIKTIDDLKGQKLGIIKGTASEYFASLVLGLHNIKVDEVSFINLSSKEMKEAILNRRVDAIFGWEPFIFKIKKALGDNVGLLKTKNLYSLSFNLVTNKNLNSVSFEKSKRLVATLKQAIDFIHRYPGKAQQIIKKRLSLEQAFIDWVWPDYRYQLSLNNSLLLTIQNEAEWAKQSKMVDIATLPNFRSIIDESVLLAIDKTAVSL